MTRFLFRTTALTLLVLLTCATAEAQWGRRYGYSPTSEGQAIDGAGMVRIKRPPTEAVMFVQLTGKGKTLAEALDDLKKRHETAAAQLEKLGAEKGSAKLSPPVADAAGGGDANQRRMEAMIAQRMARGKKVAKPAKPAVSVSATLSARWPIEGDTVEKRMLAADALREKVKAANLQGPKTEAKLSLEEQEALEEAAEEIAQMRSSNDEGPSLTEPHFLFVAKISAKDRDEAMARAFAKAKAQAGELAKAAGVELGPLVRVGQSAEVNYDVNISPYGRNSDAREWLSQVMVQGRDDDEASENEGMSMTPAAVDFNIAVTASFNVGKPR